MFNLLSNLNIILDNVSLFFYKNINGPDGTIINNQSIEIFRSLSNNSCIKFNLPAEYFTLHQQVNSNLFYYGINFTFSTHLHYNRLLDDVESTLEILQYKPCFNGVLRNGMIPIPIFETNPYLLDIISEGYDLYSTNFIYASKDLLHAMYSEEYKIKDYIKFETLNNNPLFLNTICNSSNVATEIVEYISDSRLNANPIISYTNMGTPYWKKLSNIGLLNFDFMDYFNIIGNDLKHVVSNIFLDTYWINFIENNNCTFDFNNIGSYWELVNASNARIQMDNELDASISVSESLNHIIGNLNEFKQKYIEYSHNHNISTLTNAASSNSVNTLYNSHVYKKLSDFFILRNFFGCNNSVTMLNFLKDINNHNSNILNYLYSSEDGQQLINNLNKHQESCHNITRTNATLSYDKNTWQYKYITFSTKTSFWFFSLFGTTYVPYILYKTKAFGYYDWFIDTIAFLFQ